MREKKLGSEKETGAVRRSFYCFWVLFLVLILSLRNLQGFHHLRFPEDKHRVHCLLCLIVVLVSISDKDLNVMLA